MRRVGGERVIRSLISYHHALGIKATLSTLPYKIKEDIEKEKYMDYIAKCARILTENTSVPAGYYSHGQTGAYINVDFSEVIGKQKQKEQKEGEATKKIRGKLVVNK